MIIDCHTHAYTKEDVKNLLVSMKENKIDKAVIMYWPGSEDFKHDVFPNISMGEVLENIKDHPNLFLAGSIRITDEKTFDSQLKELETVLEKKQIVGVKLYLGYEHFFANDPRCDAIYELCVKYNVPVIYHTGDTWKLDSALVRFANPIYIDDVAVKFPELKILVSHMGNPGWIKEATLVISKNENVYGDFCGAFDPHPRFDKEYDENLKRQIRECVAYCGGPQKLLFGTDWYVYNQVKYVKFLKEFKEFTKEDLESINHINAEKLFGI